MENRKEILLRAAYDLLTKCDRAGFVVEANSETAFYDAAVCDGSCLRTDIASELGIDEDADPIPVPKGHRG